jgi:tRNA threonylcarbamoyladenosine biosynthesis protein TsaE
LYHFDLYRLRGDDDVLELGFSDYFSGSGVSLVEWPERLQAELPAVRLEIFMKYINENVREIELVPVAPRFEKLIELLPNGDKN